MAADAPHSVTVRPTPNWVRPLALTLVGAILVLVLGATLLWAGTSSKKVPTADPYAFGYEPFCDQPELGGSAGRLTYGLRVPTGKCLHYVWLCRSHSGSCPVPQGYAIAKSEGE
jgi:hypothetical protein